MICILKYNAGNTYSVKSAIESIGYKCVISDNIDVINKADKVIIPGVGEASSAMDYLIKKDLDKCIKQLSQPVLGICLGMQLLCNYSEEGNTDCLGIFNTKVNKFQALDIVPHVGWNNINALQSNIFNNVQNNSDVYFVHSYYADLCIDTIAVCDYILPFSAALHKNNYYATQFHPEKSGEIGFQILKNFLKI